MKLTIIFLFAGLMSVRATGIAQTITYQADDASIQNVFKAIEKQTDFVVFYNKNLLQNASPVTVKVSHMPLMEFLQLLFAKQPLDYQISNKTIVIVAKNKTAPVDKGLPVKIVEQIPVKGTVLSEDGKPLAGASIIIKGTKTGTRTNENGVFTINAEPGDVLMISFVGYEAHQHTIKGTEEIKVRLKAISNAMEGIVVTGLFERPTENFTGAAKTMTGTELKQVNSSNVFAAISALDPSFRIVPNNVAGGNINQLPEIQLRGQNSFPNLSGELSSNPNAPLFILDGFEVNLQRVVDLDMNLIESITLLKDASATSVYGSRGANGVMVITTIAPASGKIQVTFNNDYRISTPDLSVYHLLNAEEKLDFEKRAGVYVGLNPRVQYDLDQIYNHRLGEVRKGVETDWLSKPVQVGHSNRSSLYLQGGDAFIRYGVQLSADFQQGVMKGQSRDNYSGQFDLSYQVKKLRFKNSLRVFQNVAHESPYGSFSTYTQMNPYWRPYDENGNVNKVLESNMLGNYTNPLYDATLHSINKSQYFGITNNFQIRYNVLPSLFLETSFSLNKQTGTGDEFYSAQHTRFANVTDIKRRGSYRATNNNQVGYESLTTANFNKLINKSMVYSTLGLNIASNNRDYYSIITEGFPFDRLDNLLFAAQYQPNSRPAGDESTTRRMGMFFNGNYSYDNRFLLDVSLRRDGSSQFGADKRYGTFWSTGVGWNLHNEDFFAGMGAINRLKIRSSYGSTGSLNIPAYRAQTRYNFGVDDIYNGELGTSVMGLGNSTLGWQDVRTLDIGLDAVLFNERVDLRFDFYRGNTRNAITEITLAPSTGFSSYSENLGEIQNTGFEVSARYKIINNTRDGIVWSIHGNAFTNRNILKKLSNKLKATNDNANKDQVTPKIMLQEGESINTIYVVRSLGVDPTTGSEVFLKQDGSTTFTWNANDKIAFGTTDSKWRGTFGSNFLYKGLEVNLIFDYRFGGQLYNQTLINKVESVNPVYNVDRRAYDLGWAAPGDESLYTRIGMSKQATKLTSRFVQDDNTLSLASASVSYDFYKTGFLQKSRFNSLKLTAITNDLFRVSSIQIERGTSNPFARIYSLSLRAGF